MVYVSANEKRADFSNGWAATTLLGTVDYLGGKEAEILLENQGRQVVLRVGTKEAVFDLDSHSFVRLPESGKQ